MRPVTACPVCNAAVDGARVADTIGGMNQRAGATSPDPRVCSTILS